MLVCSVYELIKELINPNHLMSIMNYTKVIHMFDLSSVDFVWMIIGLYDLGKDLFKGETIL